MENEVWAGYEIHIFYSGKEEAYVAEVSGLARCVAWGESCEEALTQARGAIRAHYQLVREREDASPEPPAGSRAWAPARRRSPACR